MENLRQINDIDYTPMKGDNVLLNDRLGILLDDQFLEIHWSDNDVIESWIGGYESFIIAGGFILMI
jgi:hypothetical protein